MENKNYSVVIIGAGSIGALKDNKYDSPETENILTHAHAVSKHPRTDLLVIIDKDSDKAHKAATKWDCQPAKDISELHFGVDIIILATPTETHQEQLEYIIKHLHPKLIIAEKPFCNSYHQAKQIVDSNIDIPIMINYSRRFLPEIQQLKRDIDAGTFGKVQHAKLTYTRGLKHEACHAIDLFNYLFGKLENNLMDDISDIKDRDSNDPTRAGILMYEKCPWVFLCPADGRKFSIFDIEILFDTCKISFLEHGSFMKIQHTVPDDYGNYQMLSENESKYEKINLKRTLYYVIDNAVNFLDGKEKLICTDEDALKVHQVYCQI